MKPTPDFDPKLSAKKLLREGRSGALATLMPGSGDPYCSLVNIATAADGAPLLLISRLARAHQEHPGRPARVAHDRRAQAGRSARGRSRHADGHGRPSTDDPQARARYLARQPEAEMFAGFADFALLPH